MEDVVVDDERGCHWIIVIGVNEVVRDYGKSFICSNR